MTILASDSFTGTGAMAANWSTVTSSNAFRRVSDQLASNESNNLCFMYENAATYPNDQWAELTLKVVEATSDQGMGPAVRISNTAQTGYLVQANQTETRLYKVVATSFTQVGTDGSAAAANDVMRLEVTGTSLTVKKNGATIIGPVTDTSIASGRAGIWCFDDPVGVSRGDDWAAGDFNAQAGKPAYYFAQL